MARLRDEKYSTAAATEATREDMVVGGQVHLNHAGPYVLAQVHDATDIPLSSGIGGSWRRRGTKAISI